jgi:membrane-bound metal-dependent hydrolase YbcI (DUF457 family)
MPFAVVHMLFPILLINFFKKLKFKFFRKFSKRDLLVAGIGGILPDVDILISAFSSRFSNPLLFHRGFTHSFIFPFFFLLTGAILPKKYSLFLFLLSFGYFVHIVLDISTNCCCPIFFPLSNKGYGIKWFDDTTTGLIYASLDAVFLFTLFTMSLLKRKNLNI